MKTIAIRLGGRIIPKDVINFGMYFANMIKGKKRVKAVIIAMTKIVI